MGPLDPPRPGRCDGCRLPHPACVCRDLRPVASRVRVVVVRQAREATLTSNTGRLVGRALANAVVLDHGRPGPPLDVGPHLLGAAWVLADGAVPPAEPPAVDTLVVIDSNWASARGIRARVPPLPALPTLTLPPPPALDVRRPRRADGARMATAEAVAHALDALGDAEAAATLHALFAAFAERLARLRGLDPGR